MAYTLNRTYRHNMSWRFFSLSPGGVPTEGSYIQTATYPDYKSGSRVPNFTMLIAGEMDATSAYERRSLEILNQSNCSGNGATAADGYGRRGTFLFDSSVDQFKTRAVPDDSAGATDEAYRRFTHKVDDALHAMQSIPFVAELGKTKRGMQSTAMSFLRFVTSSKRQLLAAARSNLRGSRRPSRAAMGVLSDLWLEWKFGLDPFFQDIHDAATEICESSPPSVRIRATNYYSSGISTVNGSSTSNGVTIKTVYSYLDVTRVTLVAGLNLASIPQNRFAVDSSSIPGAMWELTPWSFLVDYFFDVSAFLQSVQNRNTRFVYCTKSTKMLTSGVSRQTASVGGGATMWATNPGGLSYKQYRFVRSSYTPSLYMPTIRVAGGLQGLRGLNIAALIGGRLNPFTYAR